MKPLGPVPQGFSVLDGILAIDDEVATALVERAGGTPLFVYSGQMLRDRMARLRAAMPAELSIHYAVKANPYIPLVQVMSELVDGFDIASGGELARIREAGIDPARVSFAGWTNAGWMTSEYCRSQVISMGVGSHRTSEGHSRVRQERLVGSSLLEAFPTTESLSDRR